MWPQGYSKTSKAFSSENLQSHGTILPLLLLISLSWWCHAQPKAVVFKPRPVPHLQAIPLPHDQVSIQRHGLERLRFHFDPSLHRPFIYPVNGPSGRSLTRMGHPHDPISHSHHNSVWISHYKVNGIDFWGDHGPDKGRILHRRVEKLEDSNTHAAVTTFSHWNGPDGTTLLEETRRIAVEDRTDGQYLIIMDLKLKAPNTRVTLGETPFGILGVRMAKSLGVNDGGGRITNAEGQVNEKEVFWKKTRWVDYSGQIANGVVEGLTLMDHPGNPNHPSAFHVRNDGWMGACLTFEGDHLIHPGKSLQLRYGIYVHSGLANAKILEAEWKPFSRSKPFDFGK